MQIERILCPVDFSEVSAKAYRYAQSIACHYRAKLILQHIVELSLHQSYYYQVGSKYAKDFRQTLISNAENQFRQFVDIYGGVEPECVVEESITADAILCLARARAVSLIVMGTHGRRGFDHLMLGSVTERVLRHSPCPLLAVPPKAADGNANHGTDEAVRVQRIL